MQQESSQFLYTIFVFMYKELDWKIDEPLENVLQRDMMADAYPTSPTPNVKSNDVIYAIISPHDTINGAFDLTYKSKYTLSLSETLCEISTQ